MNPSHLDAAAALRVLNKHRTIGGHQTWGEIMVCMLQIDKNMDF